MGSPLLPRLASPAPYPGLLAPACGSRPYAYCTRMDWQPSYTMTDTDIAHQIAIGADAGPCNNN